MDPNGSGHLLGGYIIYRMATSGWRPTADEVAQQENWVDFVPLPVDEGSQAVWHDPDGLPRTGDEVIAWHDAPFARNGEWRRYGHYPQLGAGLTWWYVVQPAARGTVNEFEGVSLAKGPVDDFRVDLDGDGLFDAVDLHGSNGEDGPEFVSPQAEAGASGLGLTHDRRPIVSKLMAWNDCLLAGGAESLRVTKQGLHWSGQRDVLDWEVRRAVVPERLAVVPAAGELRTWRVRGDASTDPVAEPGPTGLVCYRIQPLCQP